MDKIIPQVLPALGLQLSPPGRTPAPRTRAGVRKVHKVHVPISLPYNYLSSQGLGVRRSAPCAPPSTDPGPRSAPWEDAGGREERLGRAERSSGSAILPRGTWGTSAGSSRSERFYLGGEGGPQGQTLRPGRAHQAPTIQPCRSRSVRAPSSPDLAAAISAWSRPRFSSMSRWRVGLAACSRSSHSATGSP